MVITLYLFKFHVIFSYISLVKRKLNSILSNLFPVYFLNTIPKYLHSTKDAFVSISDALHRSVVFIKY